MLFLTFKWEIHNCIWCHPYVITDKGSKIISFNDVRLRGTAKQYINSGWHASYCFKINDIIRKLDSFILLHILNSTINIMSVKQNWDKFENIKKECKIYMIRLMKKRNVYYRC
jgi:hypothetical protein